MKPWEAFFDKTVLHKFQHIYLPEEKGLKEGAIKRYIANFITQTRNLNIQRNTVEMKDANGLIRTSCVYNMSCIKIFLKLYNKYPTVY